MKWRVFRVCVGIIVLGWLILDVAPRAYAYRRASRLIDQLAAGDPFRRSETLKELGEMGAFAAPAAAAALRHGDAPHRRAGLMACEPVIADCVNRFGIMNCAFGIVPERAAADLGFQLLGPALSSALGDRDAEIRFQAANLVTNIPAHELENASGTFQHALSVLHAALKTQQDSKTRLSIIEAIARVKPSHHRDGIAALVEAVKDPDEDVRRSALSALMGSLAEWGISRERDCHAKLKTIAPQLMREARDLQNPLHFNTLIALGTAGELSVIAMLIDNLRDTNEATRTRAVAAFQRLVFITFASGFIDNEQLRDKLLNSIPLLIACLDDPADDVRTQAASALQSMGAAAAPAIPALEKAAAKEPRESVRGQMNHSLEWIRIQLRAEANHR